MLRTSFQSQCKHGMLLSCCALTVNHTEYMLHHGVHKLLITVYCMECHIVVLRTNCQSQCIMECYIILRTNCQSQCIHGMLQYSCCVQAANHSVRAYGMLHHAVYKMSITVYMECYNIHAVLQAVHSSMGSLYNKMILT